MTVLKLKGKIRTRGQMNFSPKIIKPLVGSGKNMSKRIYAGNLSYITTEDTLKNVFSAYGELISVNLIIDKDTQQSKGFGFIEFADDDAAEKAIAAQNGKELDGRKIRVSMAEEKKERERRPSGGDFRRKRY